MINLNKEKTNVSQLLTKRYPQVVMAHDSTGYAELYADDVLWAPPGAPDQMSKAGIKQGIQSLFDKFSFEVAISLQEIDISADQALVIGNVAGRLTPRDGSLPRGIIFRILWLLRREEKEWRISRQIWNNKPVNP